MTPEVAARMPAIFSGPGIARRLMAMIFSRFEVSLWLRMASMSEVCDLGVSTVAGCGAKGSVAGIGGDAALTEGRVRCDAIDARTAG